VSAAARGLGVGERGIAMRPSFALSILLLSSVLGLAASAPAQRTVQTTPGGPFIPLPHGGVGPEALPQLALPRGALDLRVEPAQTTASGGWITTEATTYVHIPRASATFVAAEDDTELAICFSAEASTDGNNARLFVRALVDGVVADPADVVFTEGVFAGARSFTFTHVVDAGVHTVEMQWLVDAGFTASLRAQAVELRHGGTVAFDTPPSGPEAQTTSPNFVPVPGTSVLFHVPVSGRSMVGFSAETFVIGSNKRMFVRALVDGVPCSPGDVVFAQRSSRQCHQMRFATPTLAEGWHTATIEWLIDAGGVGMVGDRTLWVTTSPRTTGVTERIIVPASGPPVSTSSSTWAQVPGLSALLTLPKNAEIAAAFSGEVQAGTSARLEMRFVTPGGVVSDVAVLAQGGFPFETQSFTFDRKHVFQPTTTLSGMWLEWRAIGGLVSVADRALHLTIESGLVPDLAEAPEIGRGSADSPEGQRVEAALGARRVLTLIHRIPRAAPNHVIPTIAQVQGALYGAEGMADYYDVVSGGRFGLVDAGIFQYDALKTEDHYWNHASFNCGMPLADGFKGGHAERWAEVVQLASADVNFAAFDTDGDGVLQPDSELAVLIVVPQQQTRGFTRNLDAYCSNAPVVVDGVVVPEISEWFTSSPASNWEVPTHELAHLILRLTDLYSDSVNFDTEVGVLSLMGDNLFTTTHLDPFHKLALGWATPWYAPMDGEYALQDVKESGDVLVLPRAQDGDGMECFLVETRHSEWNDPLYDEQIGADGSVVWHIVESPAENAAEPACTTPAEWAAVSGNGRRAIRVVRPGVDFAGGSVSDWTSANYDLLDHGLSCPGIVFTRNALLWADGNESGWNLLGFSAGGGPWMGFVVDHD
jgi:M6 family metalloprotease-like protein